MRLDNNELALKNLRLLMKFEALKDQEYADARATIAQIYLNLNAPDTASTDILKYRSKHSAKGDIGIEYKGLRIGLSAFYTSFQERIDETIEFFVEGLADYRMANAKGDIVFDARIGYTFSETASVSLIIKNLFNTEYTLRPAYFEAPLNFIFQTIYEF